jgi:hypothetical protein
VYNVLLSPIGLPRCRAAQSHYWTNLHPSYKAWLRTAHPYVGSWHNKRPLHACRVRLLPRNFADRVDLLVVKWVQKLLKAARPFQANCRMQQSAHRHPRHTQMHICMWHGKSNINILQDLVLRKREAWALEKRWSDILTQGR